MKVTKNVFSSLTMSTKDSVYTLKGNEYSLKKKGQLYLQLLNIIKCLRQACIILINILLVYIYM